MVNASRLYNNVQYYVQVLGVFVMPIFCMQCLCVLMKLLHRVSEVAKESLMDASNLGIVLAPNLMRPQFDIFAVAQSNPFKNQAGKFIMYRLNN